MMSGFPATLRTCSALMSLVLAGLSGTACADEPYRLIFNCDGNAVFVDAEGNTDQWLRNLFEPLEDSHVDALFWCDGAGGNTANYDSQVLELTGQRIGQVDPHLRRLIDEGNDPPKLVIREARKRGLDVFYSFRINDIHDSFLPGELPTFKKERPEWLLGKQKYGNVVSYPTALNFAMDEVRELKFQTVREIFEKYDFDGLEIDWLRSAPYFPPGSIKKNAHLLTGLLKRIRTELNARADQRGKPVRLAVRVDETLRGCTQDGFEVKRWIDEGLIDMLILGSGTIDINVAEFRALTRGTPVTVYPCLYGWPSRYQPIPRELACGLTLNYWAQEADGIYLFNWFPHQKGNSEPTAQFQRQLMKTLGDPARILATEENLMFAADRGQPHPEYPGNWLDCVLPAELQHNGEVRFHLRTSGLPAGDATVYFRLEFDQPVDASSVQIRINKTELKPARQENALTASFDSSVLARGDNSVHVTCITDASPPKATIVAAELRLAVISNRNAGK